MELKDFVSQALKDIIAGVKDAQSFAFENGACINPNQIWKISTKPEAILDMGDGTISILQPVHFDVCVTNENKMSGQCGIQVVSGSTENMTNTASRIKFSVAVSLPRMKPNYSSENPDYGVSAF